MQGRSEGGQAQRTVYHHSAIKIPLTLFLPAPLRTAGFNIIVLAISIPIICGVAVFTNFQTFSKSLKIQTLQKSAVQIYPHSVGPRLMFPGRKPLFSGFSYAALYIFHTKQNIPNIPEPQSSNEIHHICTFTRRAQTKGSKPKQSPTKYATSIYSPFRRVRTELPQCIHSLISTFV